LPIAYQPWLVTASINESHRKTEWRKRISRPYILQDGGEMQTREDLVELARVCLKQARVSENPVVVAELTHLAKGYQVRAASMDNGKLPDIGEQAAGKDEG
jgi:hypothetical protein